MTKITALIIQNNYPNNILIASAKQENGKYTGFLYLLRNEQIHSHLATTHAQFDSEQSSNEALNSFCKDIKNLIQ